MPSRPQLSRIDTLELKEHILRKLGRQKAEKYFYSLNKLLSLKLKKSEFTKLIFGIIGKENLPLHNQFIKSILTNAYLSHSPPNKQTTTGHSQNTKISSGHLGNLLPMPPQKGRSVNNRYRRINDRPSPLGPHGKIPNISIQDTNIGCEIQIGHEVISITSKAPVEVISVEDGEEVDQMKNSPGVQSRSPITAPLGSGFDNFSHQPQYITSRKYGTGICQINYELPDLGDLRKCLETKLEKQGLSITEDCVNLLNHGLDVYLKRLIQPCMELTKSSPSHTASLLDFKVAMESKSHLLGGDGPVLLEKYSMFSQHN